MTNEFYYEELKGLKIIIDGSIQNGFVKDVFNFGSGEVLVVSLDDSGATRYIPFDRDNVSEIDLSNRTIVLTPIKGLLKLKSTKKNMYKTQLSAKVITLYPELFPGPLSASVTGRALEKKIWSLDIIDLKKYGRGRHKKVDDKPISGGPGMILRPDVLDQAILKANSLAAIKVRL